MAVCCRLMQTSGKMPWLVGKIETISFTDFVRV